VAITPNGAFAYTANAAASTVSVISTATNTVIATVPVGTVPHGVAITPDGAFAYVGNEYSSTVSVINTATNTVVDTVNGVAVAPEGVAIMHQRNALTSSCR
jgi:YVTN family beta-propeller protein